MVFWLTSAFGSVSFTPACAPTSTARASAGVICSIGLPVPAFRTSRNTWVLCSTPVPANALLMDRARRVPVKTLLKVFMFVSCSGLGSQRLDGYVQTHIDVATGGVGVRADLVGRIDQCLCIGLFKTRQADVQVDVQTEAARDLADADVGGDRSVVGDAALGLAGHEFQGADEAGGVAGGEQLL